MPPGVSMADRIRLSDLARQAGVSTATVSRVLNGKETVAPATRQAVLTALDLLGYERPEKLREHPGGRIGLIVPELTNPIFPIFAQNIETTLSSRGYTPLLCTQTAGGITEDSYVELLIEQHVAGIVFISGLHADSMASVGRYARLTQIGLPYVTVNGPNPEIATADFSTDAVDAVTQCVRHLVSLGHTAIGLAMGPERFIPSQLKVKGFVSAMNALAPGAPAPVVHTLYTVEGGQSAARALLADGCTAIVCGSDIMALGVIRQCASQGLSVPEDVSVVGFDDSPLMAFSAPPLTTIRQPVRAICEGAVSSLMALVSSSETPTSMEFHGELIVRESTAPCRT